MTTHSWEELAKHLPSRKNFYNKFEGGAEECKDNCTSKVDSALSSLSGQGGDSVNRIKAAWYYAHYMYKGKDNESNSAPCEFLYYWIGDLLSKNHGGNLYESSLRNICNGIKNTYEGKGCKLPCDSIKEEKFQEMKIIHDFSYDYEHIRDYLIYYTTNHSTNFSKYRTKIKETAETMDTQCDGAGDAYCRDFLTKLKDRINGNLSELESDVKSAEERKVSAEKAESLRTEEAVRQAVTNATTTASLTSILGTLATVATPLLLYKYNYLPSGISNLFSGRNGEKGTRRKRRRSIGHDFDASTVDNLTEYTMDNSTIDPMDGVSSTLRSAVYSTGQSSGGRNNTRGPGIVGYQNM
ncbi:KIR protein [Plasmodium knowlesi strain H]|uniref:KIR protein n=3 Tax=Plasmodium knowlesi TaxID=5850 RepID=A0A5K1UEH5_PLAKH|nr:KIR protein [Plasmodium knowlesi strain H]OTN67124.1 KIR protein [Plasmodium knowlesi]CAA9988716.1 KIR protein [Plasmodium knowlesi strain H]SBO21667.1 KIR protein [Plasmodium knowlesi strain H]SBO22021.1 KIR protein [Plasmodium knowlesi strain H]VVS78190.1 KIR protein [Plasmodium knowlesi strain H]|eukprot:XP_002259692.1 KIR protein [Plasmodium knowlesi strain H]